VVASGEGSAEEGQQLGVQPQEAAHAPGQTRVRPGRDGIHLVAIHSDTVSGDDMAEVGDRRRPEGALGALQVEVMGAEGVDLQVEEPRALRCPCTCCSSQL
jgi:hypothetical protein